MDAQEGNESMNLSKLCKTAVSLILVIALLIPYAGAIAPEQYEPPVGSETSSSPTAVYPWEYDLGQDTYDEAAHRSLEELKALDGVALDQSGRATSINMTAGVTNEEMLRLLLDYDEYMPTALLRSTGGTISQSIEDKLQDTFGFSPAVIEEAVALHGDMGTFQAELRYYLVTKEHRTINTEMENMILQLICSGYTANQAFGAYVAQETLGMSVEELAQAKRAEIELVQQEAEEGAEAQDDRNSDYLDLATYMGIPYNVIEDFMMGYEGDVQDLRASYAADKATCYALSPTTLPETQKENEQQLEPPHDAEGDADVQDDEIRLPEENSGADILPSDAAGTKDALSEETGTDVTEETGRESAQFQSTPVASADINHVAVSKEEAVLPGIRDLTEAPIEVDVPEEQAAARLSGSNNEYSPERVLDAPFSYDTIGNLDVNINTGGYKFTATDLSIPGVNGLDLNFTRIFDTTNSWTNSPIGMYDLAYEDIPTIEVGYKCLLWENHSDPKAEPIYTEIADISQYTFADYELNFVVQKTWPYATNEYEMAAETKLYLDQVEGWAAYATDRSGNGYVIVVTHEVRPIDSVLFSEAFQHYTIEYDYLVDEFGLGHGWQLGFSSIESYNSAYELETKQRLITSDGSRYTIEGFYGGTAGFENYELKDFTLQNTGNGYLGAAYTLTHKNGLREYFDNRGRNIAIVDRYGNKITLEHTIVNGEVNQIKITDTLGNLLIYKNENIEQVDQLIPNVSGVNVFNTLWTLSLNGTVIRNYYIRQTAASGSTAPRRNLIGVVDDLGQPTLYYNSSSTKKYNCYIDSPATNDGKAVFVTLTRILYPNQLYKEFLYATGKGTRTRLGISGYIEGVQLSQYEETVKGTEGRGILRNYTYSDYSNCYSSYFPNGTYSTKIQTVMIGNKVGSSTPTWRVRDETYQFDLSHLKISKTTTAYTPLQTELVTGTDDLPGQYPNAVAEVESYTHNDDYLPTQIVIKSYTWGTQNYMTQTQSYTYDNKGNVLTATKPNNQTTTYTYDSSYAIPLTATYKKDVSTTITVTNTLTTDGKGIATTEVKENGSPVGKTAYSYDSTGRVVNQKDYLDAANYVEQTFAYNGSAEPTEYCQIGVKDWSGQLVAGSPGHSAGVVAEKVTYNTRGQPIKVTDANGNETNITYRTDGRISQVTNPDGSAASYTYDIKAGTVVYKDELGTAYRYSYDAFGNLKEILDVAENKVLKTIRYNSLSQPILETVYSQNSGNSSTYYYYDTMDRLTEKGSKSASGTNIPLEQYTYQSHLGKTTKTVLGDGNAPNVVTTTYQDVMGNVVKTGRLLSGTEHAGTYVYDYLGNCIQTKTAYTASLNGAYTTQTTYNYQGQPLTVTNALNQTVSYAYDWLGNCTSTTDAKNVTATTSYDALGRILQTTQPFEGTANALSRYAYDGNGNIIRSETSNSKPTDSTVTYAVTDYLYNSRNQLVRVGSRVDASTVNYTQYYYDAMGNPLRMYTGLTAPLTITGLDQVSGGSAGYSVTKYSYDRFGKQHTLIDPLGQTETYDYDINGNLRTKLDRNGSVTAYTYDLMGRLTNMAVTKAGEQTPCDSTSYTYARSGQKLSESNNVSTAQFQYDALGRMTRETSGTTVKDYAYNIGNLRTSFVLTVSGIQELNNTYSYDILGRLETVSGSGVSAQYGYDVNGNRAAVVYGNGVSETYAYNKANLVTQVANKKGTATLSQYDYTYDLSGNQITKIDHAGKMNAYTYDGLGQLTGETEKLNDVQVQSYSYRYDAFYNRTRLTASGAKSFTTDYTYDKNNRLRNESKVEGDTTYLVDYQYDPNGNMYSSLHSLLTTTTGSPSLKVTASESLDGVTLYEYDGFNRQVGVKTAGTTASYSYLPNGLRESKTVNGTKTSFVWDGDQTVHTTVGGVKTKYLRGMNLIASLGSETSYYLYNAHRDVVQLTDNTGAVIKKYDYDAFGNEQMPSATDQNPFRYCGEYLDNETNTIYLRARYYDPSIARFTQEDPMRSGLNYYTYCHNNPVLFFDPSGLETIALRSTIEGLGGSVVWNSKTGIATVYLDGKSAQVYAGDKNGSYAKDNKMYTDDAWLFVALGTSFDLGKGWTGRIERHGSGAGFKRHVVLIDSKGNEYAQNEDGSPHDSGGSPPNSVKQRLKEVKNWDWDKKDAEHQSKIKINSLDSGYTEIIYPNGRNVIIYHPGWLFRNYYPSDQDLRNYYFGPTYIDLSVNSTVNPSPFLPMPNPVPIPVPGPIYVPVFVFP